MIIRNHSGFTLLEIICVVCLLILLTGFSYPIFNQWYDSNKFYNNYIALEEIINKAKDESKLTGKVVKINISESDNNQKITLIHDDGVLGCSDINSGKIILTAYLDSILPKGNKQICFYPDGSSTGGYLLFEGNSKKVVLTINKYTSYVEKTIYIK